MKYTWLQYDDVLTKQQCKQIIDVGYQIGFEDAKIGTQQDSDYHDPNIRNCKIASMPFKTMLWLEDLLTNAIAEINNFNFRFDIHGFSDLEVIHYNQGTYFKRHTDNFINDVEYQRKLTFIFQLTDPDEYVGGDLIVYTHKDAERVSRKQGSLIVFPSYTMHEVDELLSGTRYSMIGWVMGPEFK